MANYSLNRQMPTFEFIVEGIKVHCKESGLSSNVYKYAHYDTKKNILYLKCSPFEMLKIDMKSVTRCDNGTDGVLFSDLINISPFDYIENLDNRDYIDEYLISLCNFKDSAINRETQKTLAKAYFLALFMPELMNTKPILVLIGTKGSGKTTLLKAFIKTLYGRMQNVLSMPSKPDDLDILVVNSHFLGIDNLDTHKEGLNDKLAVYATGGSIKKRKLYTDGEMYEAELDAFIGISTRALSFKRDDILQRTILLELDPIKGGFMDENELMRPVYEYKNEIISQAINEIQRIMRVIDSGKYKSFRSGFRMADFAKFLTCYMDDFENAENHLNKMTKHQQRTCLDNDIILSYLAEFARNHEPDFYTANEIYKIIIATAVPDTNCNYIKHEFEKHYESVQTFAKRMNNIKDDIREFIDIEVRKGRANQTEYKLTPRERIDEIPRTVFESL